MENNVDLVVESKAVNTQHVKHRKKKQSKLQYIKKNKTLYLFLAPAVISVFIFNYIPMYGVLIAFQDYSAIKGFWGSDWVGLENFQKFFSSPNAAVLIGNTIKLSLYDLLWGFPAPIILAIMLNQVRRAAVKKNIQLVLYAPNFISMVVIVGMVYIFLAPSGPLNSLISYFTGEPVDFLSNPSWFRTVFVSSSIWQFAGFASIVYVAALSNVDPQLHDAATIDGASLWQRIRHIDFQTIKPVMAVLFILQLGSIMTVGFEKVYLLQTDLNLPTSEIIETYVYKRGLQAADWSFGTAVGLFQTVVGLIMLTITNTIVKKLKGESLY